MKSAMRLELWPDLGSRPSAWMERPFVTKLRVSYLRVLLSLALVVPALVPGLPLSAQISTETHPAQRAKARYKHPSIDDQVEVLTKYLELSDQQRSALKHTLEQRQEEILAMRRTSSNTGANPSDRFRMIEDKTVERIRALLTDEQLKKYDPIGARSAIPAQQQQSVEDLLKASKPRQ